MDINRLNEIKTGIEMIERCQKTISKLERLRDADPLQVSLTVVLPDSENKSGYNKSIYFENDNDEECEFVQSIQMLCDDNIENIKIFIEDIDKKYIKGIYNNETL